MHDINTELELNALFEDMAPMGAKKVAVVIGRFNPPTKGHYAVINSVIKFIDKNKKLGLEAIPIVLVIGGSKSDNDKKRNPLSVAERIQFMKASGNANRATFMEGTNAFKALEAIREKGFEPIAVAAGSDRIDAYIEILDKYFKTPDGQNIPHSKIVLTRDEDAVETNKEAKQISMDQLLSAAKGKEIDIKNVSGSLARRAVELGYEDEFASIVGLTDKPVLAKKLFSLISKAIKE